jgi:type II secretory pathway component PulF
MATDKYQLNAFLAFLIGVVGFVACILVGGLTRFVLPQQAAVLVTFGLMVSLLGFMRSKVAITPGSQKSLRLVGIVIGVAAILFTLGLLIYNSDKFQSN